MGPKRKAPRRSRAERDRLVEQYFPLVGWCLNRYRHLEAIKRLGPDDAHSAGLCGLLRGAELWDETRGVKFITYAVRCILSHIRNHARTAYLIPIPTHQMEKGRKPPGWMHYHDSHSGLPGHLPAPQAPEGPDTEPLTNALRCLDRRTRDVLRRRFWKGQTLLEVGNHYGVSRERIRQIEKEAIEKLRERLTAPVCE